MTHLDARLLLLRVAVDLLKHMDIRRGTLYSAAGNSVVSDLFCQEIRPRVLRLKGTLHDTIITATNGMWFHLM
jgi:hypothetical protein